MSNWSLFTEFAALLLVIILLSSLAIYKKRITHSLKLFGTCLVLSGCSIVLNMICVILLKHRRLIPGGINVLANSLYFWLVVLLTSVTAMYIFEKMLEHVYDQYCIVRARRMLVSFVSLYTVLIFVNLKAGVLFWFDSGGNYHRGILNGAGYGVMLLEMIFLYICFFRHRSSVSREMKHALKLFPPVVITLVAMQLINQGLLLNGIIVAFVDTILFISFFSQRRENDSVTGAGNRNAFYSELAYRVAGKQKFQVLLVVPRDFGAINQRYGHQTGNEFLYAIVLWLEETYREAAVYRYIGVTFAVIFPYSDSALADRYARELEERFEQPWVIGQYEETITAAFGSMVHTGGDQEEDQMMELLDYLLSLAKHSGQKHIHFGREVKERFLRARMVADTVRRAVKEQLFEVWYQPVYSPEKGCYYSAEALVRLRDGEGGFLSPDEFIPVAEGIGVVSNIFWQVLGEVCRFIKRNPDLPVGTISVNMSMEQFEEPDLPRRIQRLLGAWDIAPQKIKFEITERVISEDAVQVQKVIHEMEEFGFRFYLDDFGIGYSNFASVAEYHFESIKLDKSLVGITEKAEKGYNIVCGLIRLFHEMGMEVIAEGVETAGQSETLTSMGADKIQGFYYARPMPGAELVKFRG